jgi:hypothetical protein
MISQIPSGCQKRAIPKVRTPGEVSKVCMIIIRKITTSSVDYITTNVITGPDILVLPVSLSGDILFSTPCFS